MKVAVKISVLYGTHIYFIQRKMFSLKKNLSPIFVEPETLEQNRNGILFARNIFVKERTFVFRGFEKKKKNLQQFFQKDCPLLANDSAFILWQGETPPLEGENISSVSCEAPKAGQRASFLQKIAANEQLILDPHLAQNLIEFYGENYFRYENAFAAYRNTLGSIENSKTIESAKLLAMLGDPPPEHIFKLFQLLERKRIDEALLFAEKLLADGEKIPALIGILAKYRRNLAAKGNLKTAMLQHCFAAEKFAKSSRISDALLVSLPLDLPMC